MNTKGYVDVIDEDMVAGWILEDEPASGDPIVDIFLDDRYLGSAVANIEAPDLYASGVSSAARRFKFLHAAKVQQSDLRAVGAYERKTGNRLEGTYEQFRIYLAGKYNTPETLMPYCSCINAKAEFEDLRGKYKVTAVGDLRVETERFGDVKFVVGGGEDSTTSLGLPTAGRARNFWFYPESAHLGFQFDSIVSKPHDDLITINLTYLDGDDDVAMPVAVIPVGELAKECARLIPEADMIERVIGPTSNAWMSYVVGGWTNAAQLDWMSRKYMGRKLSEMDKILDWGSGCARNTRPIAKLAGTQVAVFGVDIDPVNIAWSKKHILNASFDVSDLLPPLNFDDNTFDVIYGLSIFTHLTELAQDLWLAELCRVLKPGGIAFLTFHGEAAAYSRSFSASEIENYRFRGIEDYVLDRALIEVVHDTNYYRSTFHTTDYLKTRWGKYFDIVGIEGTTGGYQWFAACRKRA